MIAFVLHLLAQLALGWLAAFGHPAPAAPASPPVLEQPAPVQAPQLPAAPPVLEHPAPVQAAPTPEQSPVADDSGLGQLLCQPGEEWDGTYCVAVQLPGETTGRQYG